MLMFHSPSFVLKTATHSVLQIFLQNTQTIKHFSLQQLPSQISLKNAGTLIVTPLFLTQADLCVVSTSAAVTNHEAKLGDCHWSDKTGRCGGKSML